MDIKDRDSIGVMDCGEMFFPDYDSIPLKVVISP